MTDPYVAMRWQNPAFRHPFTASAYGGGFGRMGTYRTLFPAEGVYSAGMESTSDGW